MEARVLPALWLKCHDSGKEKQHLPHLGQWNMINKVGDLKCISETNLGLISQCCLTKYVLKVSRQYLTNLSLKISVKLGGRNTVLLDALSSRVPMVSDTPTIIFGADVTHSENGEDASPSISVVVASQDWPEVTKYPGELLLSFKRATGQKPLRIIFYRLVPH